MGEQENILELYNKELPAREKRAFLWDARIDDHSLNHKRKAAFFSVFVLYASACVASSIAFVKLNEFLKLGDSLNKLPVKNAALDGISNAINHPAGLILGELLVFAAAMYAFDKPTAYTQYRLLGGEKALDKYKTENEDLYKEYLKKKTEPFISEIYRRATQHVSTWVSKNKKAPANHQGPSSER